MRYLLDTCVISDFIKGDPGTQARLLLCYDAFDGLSWKPTLTKVTTELHD
jgi:hypothetical protein